MDTIGKKLALKEKMAYGSPPGAVCGRDHLPVVFIS